MTKIKDIPKINRPRERFLEKGANALSTSDLLAILLGSGIKGKNVEVLAKQIIHKFYKNFLDITVNDLMKISGIGKAKALQITASVSLIKRFYEKENEGEFIIRSSRDALSLVCDLKHLKKEHLICLYLNARNALIKKETISIGLLDKSFFHPREVFGPALETRAASVILVHNHPSGDPKPSENDMGIVRKIAEAGELLGIRVLDFLITARKGNYSFFKTINYKKKDCEYVSDEAQLTFLGQLKSEESAYEASIQEQGFETKKLQMVKPRQNLIEKKGIKNIVNNIHSGDCLDIMRQIPDKTIDMVLCDLPYGTTQNKWDSIIPLSKLWDQYKRIVKNNGVIALTSQGVFTAKLILSNEKMFKYKIIWEKSKSTNFLNAKKQPLRKHEDICIFYKDQPTYNPQMRKGKAYNKGVRKDQLTGSYGDFKPVEVKSNGERYPIDVVYFKTAESEGDVYHPTQKPVELGQYLIRTFTNPGNVVLDNACGSGSFLVSAVLERRNFIGIEKNVNVHLFKNKKIDYIEICKQRISKAKNTFNLT